MTHFKIEMTVNFMNQKKSRIKTANIFIGWSAGALKKLARQCDSLFPTPRQESLQERYTYALQERDTGARQTPGL